MARSYTVSETRFAIEIILVDTHARRLIALGFDTLYSRTKEAVIRSTKRQAVLDISYSEHDIDDQCLRIFNIPYSCAYFCVENKY